MKQIDLNNEIFIYQSEDGKTQMDVKLKGEAVLQTRWIQKSHATFVAAWDFIL